MSFSKEEFAEFANNAQKLWNSCILTIKNIEETNKKKNNLAIDFLKNSTTTFSTSDQIEPSLNTYLTNIKDRVNQYEDIVSSIIKPFPLYDTGDEMYTTIYGNLLQEYNKLKKLETLSKQQLQATKSISIQPKGIVKILKHSNFELYCLMDAEINKTVISPNYAKCKIPWEMKNPIFFETFNKVTTTSDWGNIPVPIEFNENGLVVKRITFDANWLTSSIENNAIEYISNDLGKIFNNILLFYESEFKNTILSEYFPFQTNDIETPKRLIKLFQDKYTDSFIEQASGFDLSVNEIKPFTIMTDKAFLEAGGSKIRLSAMDCADCANTSDDEYTMSTFNTSESSSESDSTDSSLDSNLEILSAGKKKKNRQRKFETTNKKLKVNGKEKSSESEKTTKQNNMEQILANKKSKSLNTSADVGKLLTQTKNTLASTSANFQSLIESMTSIYQSLDRSGSQIFVKKEEPPPKLKEHDIESIIGRCTTLLKTSPRNITQINSIKSYFANLLIQFKKEQQAASPRAVYINTSHYPDLSKLWGTVYELADKDVSPFQKLKIVKINNFDNVQRKKIENDQETFTIDAEKSEVTFKFQNLDKYVEEKYKIVIDNLKKEHEFIKALKSYLDEINTNLNTPEFRAWFEGPKVLLIDQPLKKYKNLAMTIETNGKKIHPSLANNEIEADAYLKEVFDTADISKKVEASWPTTPNPINSFNDMLIGYYCQIYYLDYHEEYNRYKNLNPRINLNVKTQKIFPRRIYPTCNSFDCGMINVNNDLYHEHRIEFARNSDVELEAQEFILNIGNFSENISLPVILLLQLYKDDPGQLYAYEGGQFNITKLKNRIQQIESELADINLKKSEVFILKSDLFANENQSMLEIIVFANIDRSMMKNGDSIIVVVGPSGCGKSTVINGNNASAKGVYECISERDLSNTKLEPAIFEFYHIAFPFAESFYDSMDTTLSKQRLWRFKIEPNNENNIVSEAVENFNFGETISIRSYNANYSKEDGIRDIIDSIRKQDNKCNKSINKRDFSTIFSTPNNPSSSRSTYIQGLKVTPAGGEPSYNIILDRPGNECNYSTFAITNYFDKLKYSNPLYAVANNLKQVYFLKYPLKDVTKYPEEYFNAVSFTNFNKKTFKDYLQTILSIKQSTKTPTSLIRPHANFGTGFAQKSKQIRSVYVHGQFLRDLDTFFNNNKDAIESFCLKLENDFKQKLPPPVFEAIKTAHNNVKWLDFKIKIEDLENFKDKGYFTNMFNHGFGQESICIRDIFPMQEYKSLFFSHKVVESTFCDFFFKENFFAQLSCPLLGWLINEIFLLFGTKTTTDAIEGKIESDFVLITPNGIRFKAGRWDELNFVDFSNYVGNSDQNYKYAPIDKNYKLGFEGYMGLSKFGNQSFLNTWNSIASFLLMSASYFAIFKNSEYKDFYDVKMENFIKLSDLDWNDKAKNFYESVSINEINSKQHAVMSETPEQPDNKPITLNTMFYNAMYLMSDLLLPQLFESKCNRNERFNNNKVFDMCFDNKSPIHFRIDIPFRILNERTSFTTNINSSDSTHPSLLYSMTKKLTTKQDKWIIVDKSWEQTNKLYYIKPATVLIQVIVCNSFTAKSLSGNLSYYNIVSNL